MKYTDGKQVVAARSYKEAAEKLYGQAYYHDPGARDEITNTPIPTTYTEVHKGYAVVSVYNIGDKQGRYWGVQAARPTIYILKKM